LPFRENYQNNASYSMDGIIGLLGEEMKEHNAGAG
jgi:hypothetical protein